MLHRSLLVACLFALPAVLAAPVAPPSENPTSDANQASKKPGARPDANTLKPEQSPIRVEGETVKLPDKQFELPPGAESSEAPPPRYQGPPPDRPPSKPVE